MADYQPKGYNLDEFGLLVLGKDTSPKEDCLN